MHRRWFHSIQGKRAVWSGLFLGVLFGLVGCVGQEKVQGVTSTPMPSPTNIAVPTPVPETPTPEPGMTGEVPGPTSAPTEAPGATVTVQVTPTESPEATPTPVPEITETPSPKPSETPTPELSPEPTKEPEAEPTQEPLPTGLPEYDTLLQNGWQRAEDFFGCREIFFSGKFDCTELIVSQGRYEYRYGASAEEEIRFSIIGEELPVQQFLDELVQEKTDCLIIREAAEDYGYTYTMENERVTGRVYACGTGETEQRIRIEFCAPVTTDVQAEGYGFYLR